MHTLPSGILSGITKNLLGPSTSQDPHRFVDVVVNSAGVLDSFARPANINSSNFEHA